MQHTFSRVLCTASLPTTSSLAICNPSHPTNGFTPLNPKLLCQPLCTQNLVVHNSTSEHTRVKLHKGDGQVYHFRVLLIASLFKFMPCALTQQISPVKRIRMKAIHLPQTKSAQMRPHILDLWIFEGMFGPNTLARHTSPLTQIWAVSIWMQPSTHFRAEPIAIEGDNTSTS